MKKLIVTPSKGVFMALFLLLVGYGAGRRHHGHGPALQR